MSTRPLKFALLTLWVAVLATLVFGLHGCGTPVGEEAQQLANNAAQMAQADGLDPAQLTGDQAEHYLTLAAQQWAEEQGPFDAWDWKDWAGAGVSILLGGNAGLAFLTGRGRANAGTVVSPDASTRERLRAAGAILIGMRSPPAAGGPPAPVAAAPAADP